MAEPATNHPPLPLGPLCTVRSLEADFRRLGIAEGDVLLVHSSLSSLGWVNGGAEAVVRALLKVLGDGTLVVPTFTDYLSAPTPESHPGVPDEWHNQIKVTMLEYDSRTSRSSGMGEIAEMVRTWPGAFRSKNDQKSFAAIGPCAHKITCCYFIDNGPFGEKSPLDMMDRLDDAEVRVLLLGVGFDKCSPFHLAESRLPEPPRTSQYYRVGVRDERNIWSKAHLVDHKCDDFETLGVAFTRDRPVTRGTV